MALHSRALLALLLGAGPQPSAETSDTFDVFLTSEALAINSARQEHLASLGLDLSNKRVLEVGAGIGLHTPFFVERGCNILVTDGNAANVYEIRRRLPEIRVSLVDLGKDEDLTHLGRFDLVYCYGVLYHLSNPDQALGRMAEVCQGQILLETCVALGQYSEIHFLKDFVSNNQALSGIGCRPTLSWVLEKLRNYWGYSYITRSQPDHPDFPIDWDLLETRLLYRAVFIGSKTPLDNPELLTELPPQQPLRHGRAP